MNNFEDEEFFGQDEPRYVRLRGLIHDYPRDLGILKELAQNADDGGASQLQITLDKSISKISSSLIAKSDLLAGPAVLASNDKNFEENDFSNLRNLGDSSKIRLAGKTGRFGRGFNSVYNITDFPMLLSGEYLIVLDPCELFEESQRRGGKRWRLTHLIENEKDDILSLFKIAGYTKGSTFHEGTIFRFPIRSQTHIDNIPEKKRISEKPFTEKDFMDVFTDFEKGADSLLLFLKNLLSIRCGVSEDGSTVTKWHVKIETQNIEQVQAGRSIYHKKYATADVGDLLSHLESVDGRAEKSTFVHEIGVTRLEGVQLSMRWRVLTGFFGGDSGELIAKSKALIQAKERGVPGAGVAACLSCNEEHFPKIDSAVFCHLPIGGEDYSSKLPIHIHGAFDIDGSRIRLTGHGVGAAEDAKIRADWNDELIKSGVSRAYADLLVYVKNLDLPCFEEIEGCNHLYSLFPPHDVSQNAHLDRLSTETYKRIKEINLFRSSYGSWHVPSDLYRLPSKFEKEFEDCLLDEGFNLANPPIPENVLIPDADNFFML
jgi:sacsin